MIRSALLVALALLGAVSNEVSAAEVTVAYKGLVTRSSGPHASSFVPGQEITIDYTVETTTADNNSDPKQGVFFNGLRRLEINIPAAGVAAATETGTVQTFNDVGSDQVFFYGNATQGQLAGLPLTKTEVDFVDYTSSMISTDAIPVEALVTTESFAILYTSAGYTFVNFLAEQDVDEPVLTCTSEGFTGAKLTLCNQICEVDQNPNRLAALLRVYTKLYRSEPPCAR